MPMLGVVLSGKGDDGLREDCRSVDRFQRNAHESNERSGSSIDAAVDPVHTIPDCMSCVLRRAVYLFQLHSVPKLAV